MKRSSINAMLKRLISEAIYYSVVRVRGVARPRSVKKNIAVVFMGALGDFLVLCSALRNLKDQGANLTLICPNNDSVYEMARYTGFFGDIIQIDLSYLKRIKNIGILKKVECGIVFPAPLSRYALSDIYTLAVSAEKHFLPDTSFDCFSEKVRQIADKKADAIIPITAEWEWEKYEEFFRNSGISHEEVMPRALIKPCESCENIIAVFPGASCEEKCWNVEKFSRILKELSRKTDCKILILGDKRDIKRCSELNDMLQDRNTENRCGIDNIADVLNILKKSRLVIANDSGGAHMAITVGANVVVITGMWQRGRFFPDERLPENCAVARCGTEICKGCSKSVPNCRGGKDAADCIKAVDEKTVLFEAERLMKI